MRRTTQLPLLVVLFALVAGGRVEAGAEQDLGRVLHVISHFQHQADEDGDGFALQQLLLDFVLEKQAARRSR